MSFGSTLTLKSPTPKKKVCNFVGGVVSPLLANIYLHALDRYMESNYLNIPRGIRQKKRASGSANFLYVRYADDFVVLCNGRKEEAFQMKEELKTVLDQMGLTLSEEKTKVTHITEGFNFLGYRVIRSIGTKGKMIPKVLVPDRAIKRFCNNVRRILSPSSTNESAMAKIIAINRVVRGWCEYYRCTNSPGVVFSQLRPEIFWGMAHWLGRKYKLKHMSEVMRKYREGNTFKYKSATLTMPDEYKAKRFVARTWHNPYTERDQVKEEKDRIKRESLLTYDEIWIGNESRHGWTYAKKFFCKMVQGAQSVSKHSIHTKYRWTTSYFVQSPKTPRMQTAWEISRYSVPIATEQKRRLIGKC